MLYFKRIVGDFMNNNGEFKVIIDGKDVMAKTIMNFSLFDDYYCIYGIPNSNSEYDVCCGKIVQNTVVPIDNEKDRDLTNNIVKSLVRAIK